MLVCAIKASTWDSASFSLRRVAAASRSAGGGGVPFPEVLLVNWVVRERAPSLVGTAVPELAPAIMAAVPELVPAD